MIRFPSIIILIIILFPLNVMAQQKGMAFKTEIRKGVMLEARFLLYLPQQYDSLDRDWPLLLFLHGRGESGEVLELVKRNGPPMMIEHGHQFPFIAVSPQCPDDQRWETQIEVLDMLLDRMVERYRVDTSRIFVTGLSMGGQGTWNLAFAYPDRFAAIVPICGWTKPEKAALIKDLPVWVFHGAKDDVVPLSESENMVSALKALGSPVKFTVYPEANHDSWTETYENEELWGWLLLQRK